ncbi:hypothetical protein GCM10022408_15190 [Hymenobacter fastidiosus]|uniref:Uncharacterized protein n=1 Tax=Hymenobacter fastidiosus TaxID=486264 RepID=A0ABP7RZG7_9BACT
MTLLTSYIQTLLSDDTTCPGTWMLMGADNKTLPLVDYKGQTQEYEVEKANLEVMVHSRLAKAGQLEIYSFRPTRQRPSSVSSKR